jgi:hypothetical protein
MKLDRMGSPTREQSSMTERVTRASLSSATSNRRNKSRGSDQEGFALFGQSPLLAGESAADYDKLTADVSSAFELDDILEKIWLRDFLFYEWDIRRLRGLRLRRLNDALAAELEGIIRNCLKPNEAKSVSVTAGEGSPDALPEFNDGESDRARDLALRWARRDPSATSEIQRIFTTVHLDLEKTIADAMSNLLAEGRRYDIHQLDVMIRIAEDRRNAVLREVDRHRAMLGMRLRRCSEAIEDAEYKVIEGPLTKEK